jgi:hypothetical protein
MKAPLCKLCHVEHWHHEPHRWDQGGQLAQQKAYTQAYRKQYGRDPPGPAVKVKRRAKR